MLAWTRPEPIMLLLLWKGPRTLRNAHGRANMYTVLRVQTWSTEISAEVMKKNNVKLIFFYSNKDEKWRQCVIWDEASWWTSESRDITANMFHMLPLSPPVSPLSACLASSLGFPFFFSPIFFPGRLVVLLRNALLKRSIWSSCWFDLKMEAQRRGLERPYVPNYSASSWLLRSATGVRRECLIKARMPRAAANSNTCIDGARTWTLSHTLAYTWWDFTQLAVSEDLYFSHCIPPPLQWGFWTVYTKQKNQTNKHCNYVLDHCNQLASLSAFFVRVLCLFCAMVLLLCTG